jgi:hypothetical protein
MPSILETENTECNKNEIVNRLEEAFKKKDIAKIEPVKPAPRFKPAANQPCIKEWAATIITVSICSTILMAIVIPCFVGAQNMAKTASIKGNMRTVQIAAESFATDNHGIYAQSLDQLLPYLPGGSAKIGGKPGTPPANPLSGAAPGVVQGFKAVSNRQIASIKKTLAGISDLKPGQVSYSPSTDCKSYAIMGADPGGMQIRGFGGYTLLLSNQ